MRAPIITRSMRGKGIAESETQAIAVTDPSFRAFGDGVHDDTDRLQAAIETAEAEHKALTFPAGTYLISRSLNITDELRMIRGEGIWTVIKAIANLAAIFDFTSGGTDATANQFVTIKDLYLHGNTFANYCFYSTHLTRSNFINVHAKWSKVANIAMLNNMWINNIMFCDISHGEQDGLLFTGGVSNAVNIFGCMIEDNGRIGIYAGSSAALINIIGNTIEGNGATGIWANNVRNLNIHGNEFEVNNVGGGIVVTEPTAFTIKADVVLSGYAYPRMEFVAPVTNVSIKNNYHNTDGDCMYYACAIKGGEIKDNYNNTTGKVCLGIYGHKAYSSIRNLKMSNNRDADGLFANSIEILDAEPGVDTFNQLRELHEIQIADVPHKNYMPQDFTAYEKIVDAGRSSEIYRNADAFRNMDAFVIKKAGDYSDTWGVYLDIDNDHPELLGKLCYFGAWVKWTQTGNKDNAVRLYTSTTGHHTQTLAEAPSDWIFISVLFTMPSSGATAWRAGFRKLSAGTTDTMNIACPVLARVGDGYLSHIPDNSILEVFQKGTTGGYHTEVSEVTKDVTASSSLRVELNVPSGSRLIGCQIRVDEALAAGDTWDAAWNDGGSLQAIATNQAVAKNTKVSKFHDDNANTPITDADTDIVISKNGGGSFTAQGTIRCIAYYMSLRALGSKS